MDVVDGDEETEQARQRALHLAAEVAETDDSNVPVLLLQLKGTLTFFTRRIQTGIQELPKIENNYIRLNMKWDRLIEI